MNKITKNKLDAIQSRIRIQRRNPRFIRGPIELRYRNLASELTKSKMFLQTLASLYDVGENFPLFRLTRNNHD